MGIYIIEHSTFVASKESVMEVKEVSYHEKCAIVRRTQSREKLLNSCPSRSA